MFKIFLSCYKIWIVFIKAYSLDLVGEEDLGRSTVVTETLGLPLGGCRAKRHNQGKEREKEGFITCSKWGERRGYFAKQCLPKQQNWGSFKLRVYAYSWRGWCSICIFMKRQWQCMHIHEEAGAVCAYSWRALSRGEFSTELGQSLTESKL